MATLVAAKTPRSVAGLSLADFPILVSELDFELNAGLDPAEVQASSPEHLWWRCPEGPDHVWSSGVSTRTQKRAGCPFCGGQRVSVTNSLATLHPEIAAQIDPELNDGQTGHDVTPGSRKKLWWRCPEGPDHVWQAPVSRRTGGSSCPFCGGQRVSVTNSLATLHPEIAAQIDPELNDGLTAGDVTSRSNRKLWWRCPEGPDHVWRTAVSARTSENSGCPCCSGRQASVTNSLAVHFPEIAAQLDPELNDGLTADKVTRRSNRKLRWRCDVAPDHVWTAEVSNRTRDNSGCPCCSGRQASVTNSLAVHFPEIAAQLDLELNAGLTADDIPAGSSKKLWWRCPEGPDHVWHAQVYGRTSNNSGCPFCAGQRVSVTNSLATLHPEIAAQIDPELNDGQTGHDVTPGSGERMWWRCSIDPSHTWQTSVLNRTKTLGTNCPQCCVTGRSRLELEVAALLHSSSNCHVAVDVRVEVPGVARKDQVDLCIPKLGLLIDLDPAYWHQDVARDRGKCERLSSSSELVVHGTAMDLRLVSHKGHWTYLRVREDGAPHLEGRNIISGVDYCPEAFADALWPYLVKAGVWLPLSSVDTTSALSLANTKWSSLLPAVNVKV